MARLITQPGAVDEALRDLNHTSGVRVEYTNNPLHQFVLTGFFRAWSWEHGVYYTLRPEGADPNNSLRFTRSAVTGIRTADTLMPYTIYLS
jgi:hypothetical protein